MKTVAEEVVCRELSARRRYIVRSEMKLIFLALVAFSLNVSITLKNIVGDFFN